MVDYQSDNALDLARALRHRGFAYLGLGEKDKARADLRSALDHAGRHRPDDWAAEIEDALRDLGGPNERGLLDPDRLDESAR